MQQLHDTDFDHQLATLSEGVAIQLPEDGLEEKLKASCQTNRPLVVKLGVDPTAPDLHLGHGVVLDKLRQFQEFGHSVVLVIGDATARIGDPTGRNAARPPLTDDEINRNADTYLAQLGTYLDTSRISIRRNSSWLDGLSIPDIVKELSRLTVSQILQRRDFADRLKAASPVGMHELLYPVLQGYDSVAIKADIELGGTDQLFNNQVGRWLQEARGIPGQAVLCMPLLVGLDGAEKMSKSKGNYIAVTEEPSAIYGKIMSIPDALLPTYIRLVSGVSESEKSSRIHGLEQGTAKPMDSKKRLAFDLVTRLHGELQATEAQSHFVRTFQQRGAAREWKPIELSGHLAVSSVVTICNAIEPRRSRNELRRLISSRAIEIDGRTIEDEQEQVSIRNGTHVRIGKKGFYSIILRP